DEDDRPRRNCILSFSNSLLRSRGAFCARALKLWLRYPRIFRGGGAPRNVRVLARHPFGVFRTRQALRRRLASLGVGRPPPGALTVAILGRAPRFASPDLGPDRFQRAPRTPVVVPGGRGPEPPEASRYQPPPRDATPRSAFRCGSRTRPN